jgi:hypothetical protein
MKSERPKDGKGSRGCQVWKWVDGDELISWELTRA